MKRRILSIFLALCTMVSILPLTTIVALAEKLKETSIYGDANGDGTVDLSDIQLIERYIAGDEETISSIIFENADINSDGVIDQIDLNSAKEAAVGNLDLATITFETGEGDYIAPLVVPVGYSINRELPIPQSGEGIFSHWAKKDGNVFYPYNHVIEGDITLTAVYIPFEKVEIDGFDSFAIMEQPADLTFTVKSEKSLSEVEAGLNIITKGSHDPVLLQVTADKQSSYIISAKNGFTAGATYELQLAEGIYFEGQESKIRRCIFSIEKAEQDTIPYNDDLIFIKDTEFNTYTINSNKGTETVQMFDSALINVNTKSNTTGSFTRNDIDLEVGDVVCIYQGENPKTADFTDGGYDAHHNDRQAYVKITGVDGNTYSFQNLEQQDLNRVINLPETIPYKVENIESVYGTGQISTKDYDKETRARFGYINEPEFNKDDILLFYEGSYNNSELVYARVDSVNSSMVSFTQIDESELGDNFGFTIKTPVLRDDMMPDSEILDALKEQTEGSAFIIEATDTMIESALSTESTKEKLKAEGYTDEEIAGLISNYYEGKASTDPGDGNENPGGDNNNSGKDNLPNNPENAQDGRTLVTTGKPYIGFKIINPGSDEARYESGIGIELSVSIDVYISKKSLSGDLLNQIVISLSASFEQQIEMKLNIDVDDQWDVIILKEIRCDVNFDIKSYTSLSVVAHIFTNTEKLRKNWEEIDNTTQSDPKIKDYINKINKVGSKLKKAKTPEEVLEYQQTMIKLRRALKLIDKVHVVDGVEYEDTYALYESMGISDASDELQAVLEAQDESKNKVGLEQLMGKYEDMLNSTSGWAELFNVEFFNKEYYIKIVAVRLTGSFVGKLNINVTIGADLEYEVGKRYNFWIKIIAGQSGSDEMDLLDERFAFDFYIMGTIGLKLGAKFGVDLGIITTKIASVGINIEFGPYLKLYGYFYYMYEKTRPVGQTDWIINKEMAGAMYIEFGLYVVVKFKAQALENRFVYSPTIKDHEFPLLTAGEKENVYDFRLQTGKIPTQYIRDWNNDSSDGITMPLSNAYRILKVMDMKTGKRDMKVFDCYSFEVSFSNDAFSVYIENSGTDKENYVIGVNPKSSMSTLEQAQMRIVYKCGKLAFSKYDIDITVPIVWTTLSESELDKKYSASVVVNGITAWEEYYGPTETFSLPEADDVLTAVGYYSMTGRDMFEKYDAENENQGYVGIETENLTIQANTVFEFVLKPIEYTLKVTGVQDASGTEKTIEYKAQYGYGFSLLPLLTTGSNNSDSKNFTEFDKLTYTVGDNEYTFALTDTVDLNFTANCNENHELTVKANYTDLARKAKFSFVGISLNPIDVIFRSGDVPELSTAYNAVTNVDATIDSITPNVTNSLVSIDYTVHCSVVEEEVTKSKIRFNSNGGSAVADMDVIVGTVIRYAPAIPTRQGYIFNGWYLNNEQFKFDSSFIMPDYDIELVAKWTAKELTVYYYSKGEDGTATTETLLSTSKVTYDGKFGTLPKPGKANSGKRFVKWVDDYNNEVRSRDNVPKTTNDYINLHAVWADKYNADDLFKMLNFSDLSYEIVGNSNIAYATYTFDGNAKPLKYSPNGNAAATATGITITYRKEGNTGSFTTDAPVYVNNSAANAAGVYDVRIVHGQDLEFQNIGATTVYTMYNNKQYVVKIRIKKASISTSYDFGGASVTNSYGNVFIPRPISFHGDGTFYYTVTNKANSSQTKGSYANVISCDWSGDTYCYIEVQEGLNYLGSGGKKLLTTINVAGPKTFNCNIDFTIATGTDTWSGTNDDMYGMLYYRSGRATTKKLMDDSGYDDFENGKSRNYTIASNVAPWEITKATIRKEGSDDWQHGGSVVKVTIDDKLVYNIQGTLGKVWFNGTVEKPIFDETTDGEVNLKRIIYSWGNWDSTNATPTGSKFTYSYNGTVTDQYSTYNAFEYYGAPEFTCLAVTGYGRPNDRLKDYDKFVKFTNYNSFEIDLEGCREQMTRLGISEMAFLAKVSFTGETAVPFYSTSKYIIVKANKAAETKSAGSVVNVPVSFDANAWGAMGTISYDKQALELVGIENGNVLADNLVYWSKNISLDEIKFLATNESLADLDYDGNIINLKFKVLKDNYDSMPSVQVTPIQVLKAEGSVAEDVTLQPLMAFAKFVDGLTGDVLGTQFLEYGGDATLLTPPVHDGYIFTGWDSDGKNITGDTTITAQYRVGIKLGDINADGVVNTGDAVMLLKVSAGMLTIPEEQEVIADVNKDGIVNTGDAVTVLKFAADMIILPEEWY